MRPVCIEQNGNEVYIRGNVSLQTRAEDGQETRFWTYEEVEMTREEFDRFRDLQSIVPSGMWNAGLQEAGRTVRYERMDGRRAKCERMIRLGIDTEVHTSHLDMIDRYCEEVRQTQFAEGYPYNDPMWPEEPDL